ncbi:FeoB-associated Cys-rich membrane protein [Lachnoclostridium sp. MSJ-17]|uniref:FeoB-associated Cys-rich membrane protein n=1 Tax=Lachnoclostridium sp. MSJ-17 TaxID=2841516 RepID=UPI00209FE92C|nr:FeoB-associated Cys-rich membrane protein [Lachnoclostridium sp. MSJ-17]
MEWLAANWGTIAAGAAVAAVLALIIINIVKKKKHGQSACGCSCADCPMKDHCR